MDELARRRKARVIDTMNDRDSSVGTIVDDLGIARGMLVEARAEAEVIGHHTVAADLGMALEYVEQATTRVQE